MNIMGPDCVGVYSIHRDVCHGLSLKPTVVVGTRKVSELHEKAKSPVK